MEKISSVLIGADPQKQTTGTLATGYDPETKKFDRYCALGFLACQKQLLTEDNIREETAYFATLPAYGIENKLTDSLECPACGAPSYKLTDFIVHLNDTEEFTFEEIGKALEKAGY